MLRNGKLSSAMLISAFHVACSNLRFSIAKLALFGLERMGVKLPQRNNHPKSVVQGVFRRVGILRDEHFESVEDVEVVVQKKEGVCSCGSKYTNFPNIHLEYCSLYKRI